MCIPNLSSKLNQWLSFVHTNEIETSNKVEPPHEKKKSDIKVGIKKKKKCGQSYNLFIHMLPVGIYCKMFVKMNLPNGSSLYPHTKLKHRIKSGNPS